ncbi:GTP cyclohydrolase I [Phyllobacterium endophyticum]|uniref:GTP cyclohydrolase I n=1 Tax=Phyllobacterium endophyticum TaxID=1149773 RepID=UPI0011C95AAD|nr:GTP cyclohydrolase [Phyllobacterium endophyticum]
MIGTRDQRRAARAIDEFLHALGFSTDGELSQTGALVAKAWDEDLLQGEGVPLAPLIRSGCLDLGEGPHGIAGLRGIDVTSMCPHHLMPSHGSATVAYLPDRLAPGLGKVSQLVHTASRRLVLQETLGLEIAKALCDGLGARGALCRLEMSHTCLISRGERQSRAIFDTVAFAGSFNEDCSDRSLVLAWLNAA